MTNHLQENNTSWNYGNNEMADRLRRDAAAMRAPSQINEAGIILQREDVETRADAVIDSYWENVRAENQLRTNISGQPRLGVLKRLRRQSITLAWFHTLLYKHQSETKTKWNHIEKPRGPAITSTPCVVVN